MEAASENIIQVSNLSKSYKAIKAVDDISFEVKRGKLFAFLGVNGAGKSTTINMLTSIIKKDAGRVIIDGHDIDAGGVKIKKTLGIVFQNPVLDAELTVAQNLRSRASLYGASRSEIRERIEYLKDTFSLGELLKRSYGTLSGGQRRRVDIARALVHDPKILFLDEPTTGLDPNTRITVWGIIGRLIEEKGLTVFLTTHYMEEAARADRVMIIDAGKIVASGSPDELKSKYTTDFVRIINEREAALEAVLNDEGLSFVYRNNSYYAAAGSPSAALEFLSRHKEITEFEILKGDMDDVFLTVTGKLLEGQVSK